MIVTGSLPRHIIESRIDKHLKSKLANHTWLDLFFNDEKFDAKNFPYIPDVRSLATLDRATLPGSKTLDEYPTVEAKSKKPKYVVLIPAKASFIIEKVARILKILKKESYGTTSKESKDWVQSNLAVVIALNRPKSIDNEVNQDFIDQVHSQKKVKGIAYRVFGFFWNFRWKRHIPKSLEGKVQLFYPDLYSVEKCYLLLKSLNFQAAKKVRELLEDKDDKLSLELSKIINMQKIRQMLLTQKYTQEFLDHFADGAPESPRYLFSGDADVITIRCPKDNKGLFEHYDNLIDDYLQEIKVLPDFLSTGYKAAEDENPVLKAIIDIDMGVRRYMTIFFPAYLPEPNFAWHVRKKVKASDFSFIGRGKNDRKLESLRLMQNAVAKKLSNLDLTVFGKCGQVTTNTERMRTKAIKGKTKVTFNKREDFSSLRSRKAQSQAFPRNWANQIYPFLNIKAKKMTDVTKPLTKLYSVFHPIGLIQEFQSHLFCSWNQSFKDVMNFYSDYIKCVLFIWTNTTKREERIQEFCNKYKNGSKTRKQSLEIFVNYNIDNMFEAKASLQLLIDKSANANANLLKKILQVTLFSGCAIFFQLRKYK